MKLNKRIKNAIFQWLVFNIIILFIFLYIIFYIVVPWYKKYEENKNILVDILTEKEIVEKKWIDFNKMKSLEKSLKKDNYTKFIFNKLTKSFYDKNFINTWKTSFKDFIKEKTIEINKEFEEGSYSKRIAQIDKVLPTYTSLWKSVNWVLNDLVFINYVENLFYIFNLEVKNYSLGVPKLQEEKKYINKSKWKKDLINTDIYKIPMTYTFSWRKKDILDFIHFIVNVWNIDIENWEISFYTDFVIKKRTTIYWKVKPKDYNIYKNQIMDIESLKIKKYLDSSIGVNWEKIPEDFNKYISYIKKNQWKEELEITLSFNFYVKWLPSYEVIKILRWEQSGEKDSKKDSIEWIIPKQTRLLKEVESTYKKAKQILNKNKSSEIIALLNKLDSIKEVLVVMWKELTKIDNNISKKWVDIKLYNKIMEYDNKLNYIELLIKEEKDTIETINTKIN